MGFFPFKLGSTSEISEKIHDNVSGVEPFFFRCRLLVEIERKMKTFISILMLLLFPLSVYSGQIDSPAPSFSLKDAKGKTVTLADYRGKVLLLDFWAPWCGPCKEEMPELEALYGKYGKDGFEIIGISVDTSERSVSSFLQKVPLSFTILLDQSGKVAEAYRFSHLPTGFIVGRDGVIRHIHKGFAKNFVPVYEKEIEDLLKQQ